MKTGISENQINKLIEEGFFDKERNIVESEEDPRTCRKAPPWDSNQL